MFESSEPFLLFDYFRVPYDVVGERDEAVGALGQLAPSDRSTARELAWPRWNLAADRRQRASTLATLGDAVVCARLAADREARGWLDASAGWKPVEPLRSPADDRVLSHVWRNSEGGVFLPFAPSESITNTWSERYQRTGEAALTSRARTGAMWAYYRMRPVLPRSTQIAVRRAFSRVQARRRFPRWPVEPGLHALYDFLFREVAQLAGSPVPRLAPWPQDFRWALVLTHDVETALGYENIGLLRGIEEALDYRSSWNLVPRRYDVSDDVVADLGAAGFEVGVHGLFHDGHDLESERMLRERLPQIRAYADRWRAVGFRSPATHRNWDLMPLLPFDYDSSYPDTDPFEPQAGGCCSWLPFFNRDLVELPITLPQDHTLFTILGRSSESEWLAKARRIRAGGGMALVIVHPDYMLDPPSLATYERFLMAFRDDATAWKALPKDVSAWWRRRAASSIRLVGGRWTVSGPAEEEARIELVEAEPRQAAYL